MSQILRMKRIHKTSTTVSLSGELFEESCITYFGINLMSKGNHLPVTKTLLYWYHNCLV
uniref:Uncharacterized protein n=1 Tax=Rhizophora mucronata TaxID=61149 RepID=A0A2P2J244_RHIMU